MRSMARRLTTNKNDRIETKGRQIFARSEHVGAIVASLDYKEAVLVSGSITTWPVCTITSNPAVCRAAKVRTAWPGGDASVLFQTKETEMWMVDATLADNDVNWLYIAKRMVDTSPQHPFYFMVVSNSRVPILFLKNTMMTTLVDAPSQIFPVHEEIPVHPANSVLFYKSKLNKKRQYDRNQQVTQPASKNQGVDWKNQLGFNRKYDSNWHDLEPMLTTKYFSALRGQMRRMLVTKRCIPLSKTTVSVHLHHYRAGPCQR